MAAALLSDPGAIRVIQRYCAEKRQPTWVIVTLPDSPIGGCSARPVSLGEVTSTVQVANGDIETVLTAQVAVRVAVEV